MHVIATAGHVDHGKSTLVRALTGMEPDRFAEELRRGMTIDLGYAWTTLAPDELAGPDDDPVVAFVDVPGHERFIATMLAGLGPAPAVLFVVAADEGWRRQSGEHLAAIDALGLTEGLLVITRSDLADPAPAIAQARGELARSSLGAVEAVAVSGLTGAGLPDLRRALGRLVGGPAAPADDGRLRFWVDRTFTIRGAGTVVTGTLGTGTVSVGDELVLGARRVRIRGLQTLGATHSTVRGPARVAINLRGVEVDEVSRGEALLTPSAWPQTTRLDVAITRPLENLPTIPLEDLPTGELMVHLGTATVAARLRRLDGVMARLTLDRALPVEPGDRLVLRDPGRHAVVGGAEVLDVDPPELRRRGSAKQRAAELIAGRGDAAATLSAQVARRGAVRRGELIVLGVPVEDLRQVRVVGDWLVDPATWAGWLTGLGTAVAEKKIRTPLDPRLETGAAARLLGGLDPALVLALAAAAGLVVAEGRVSLPGSDSEGLGPAEPGVRALVAQLTARPFRAPERPELEAWGLGPHELAAAERTGRIVRLSDDVVLLPTGPAQAMRVLVELPQPFTAGVARVALDTTRRVVIPLLEHLDRRGWTVRVDDRQRRVKGR